MPAISIPAWMFWLSADTPTPKATIRKWALALAEAIGDTSQEEAQDKKVMGALMPSTIEEFKRAEEEQKHVRFPKTPEEWAELENRSQKEGPGGFYSWTHGEKSFLALAKADSKAGQ